MREKIVVSLTRNQAYLIVEQMDKGSAAWEDALFGRMANQISAKVRKAIQASDLKAIIAKLKVSS